MANKNTNDNKNLSAGDADTPAFSLEEFAAINSVLRQEMTGIWTCRGDLRKFRSTVGKFIIDGDAKNLKNKVKRGKKLFNKWLMDQAGLPKEEVKECRHFGTLRFVTFRKELDLVGDAYINAIHYNILKFALEKNLALIKVKSGQWNKIPPNLDCIDFIPGQILINSSNGDTFDLADLTCAQLKELLRPVANKSVKDTDQKTKPVSKDALQKENTMLRSQLEQAMAIIKQRIPQEYEIMMALRQDKGSCDPAVIELQRSDIENGDMPTLVPDAVDDTGSKVLEVADDTVDEADVKSTVDEADEADLEDPVDEAGVEADVETIPDDGPGIAIDDLSDGSNQGLEDLFSLDFDIDGNSDGMDDSDFYIPKIPMAADAIEKETDVKVKKVRSARNIAPFIGTHGNTPYAGGAF